MSRYVFILLMGSLSLPATGQPTLTACNAKEVLANVNQLIERQLFKNTCGPNFKISFNMSHMTYEMKTLQEVDKTKNTRGCKGTIQLGFNSETQKQIFQLSELIKPVAERIGNSEKFNLARKDRIDLIAKPINYIFGYEITHNLMTGKDMISFRMGEKYETQLYCGIYEEFLAGERLLDEVKTRK